MENKVPAVVAVDMDRQNALEIGHKNNEDSLDNNDGEEVMAAKVQAEVVEAEVEAPVAEKRKGSGDHLRVADLDNLAERVAGSNAKMQEAFNNMKSLLAQGSATNAADLQKAEALLKDMLTKASAANAGFAKEVHAELEVLRIMVSTQVKAMKDELVAKSAAQAAAVVMRDRKVFYIKAGAGLLAAPAGYMAAGKWLEGATRVEKGMVAGASTAVVVVVAEVACSFFVADPRLTKKEKQEKKEEKPAS